MEAATEVPRAQRTLQRAVAAVVVVAATVVVLRELHPELILRNTTTNGGDTGAHVWWPAYMRDHVFPNLRLSGWAPDWYAGFPVGHFYFPVAALLVVFLDLVLPYNVAFKLVTAAGPLLLPVAAFSFARGIRAPWPAPPLFAAATLPFLFFPHQTHGFSFHIMGGNLPSTLAGEFSFSIALAVALFFLGSLSRALREHRRLWVPALLLGITVMAHVIVGVFAAVCALVVWVAGRPGRNLRVAAAIGAVAFLVSAVWSVPMVGRLAYATDMGWGKVTNFRDHLLHPDLRWALILAGVGLIAGAAFLRRATLVLAAMTGAFAAGFVFLPEGRLWNLRLFPFFQLSLLLLAAMGVTELVQVLPRLVSWLRGPDMPARLRDETGSRPAPPVPDLAPAPAASGERARRTPAAGRLPAGRWALFAHGVAVAGLVVAAVYVNDPDVKSFVPGWSRWNYEGYEAKAAYPEYREIMDTLNALPVPPGQRLLWERLNRLNDYGSDLALELIPYFTDGKVGSMEGLYFESAATTPYHFMTVAELASEPSNPVRGLPYRSIHTDFGLGVRHLQLMGVRFYLAGSDLAKQRADAHPDLRLVTTIPAGVGPVRVARWNLYEVRGARVVEPLRYEPVVLEGVRPRHWRGPAVEWFNDPDQLDRVLAAGGPPSWLRVAREEALTAPRRPLPGGVTVSDVRLGDDSVRFRVSRPGVPVLVKVSYFPNWQARGARGPWRVTPNFMVVVPTGREVELTYARTPIDRAGEAMTLLGLVGLVALARWRPGGRAAEDDTHEGRGLAVVEGGTGRVGGAAPSVGSGE